MKTLNDFIKESIELLNENISITQISEISDEILKEFNINKEEESKKYNKTDLNYRLVSDFLYKKYPKLSVKDRKSIIEELCKFSSIYSPSIEFKEIEPNDISLENVVLTICFTFQTWMNDKRGWDKRFNPNAELRKNTFSDILDYYDGWDDIYDNLQLKNENEIKEFDDFISDNFKEINIRVKNLLNLS
jgi:hypothetical protein